MRRRKQKRRNKQTQPDWKILLDPEQQEILVKEPKMIKCRWCSGTGNGNYRPGNHGMISFSICRWCHGSGEQHAPKTGNQISKEEVEKFTKLLRLSSSRNKVGNIS